MPKSILITGTNPGGIGNQLAREFHSRGLRVFATARNTSSITDLADLGIETLSLEVTEPESIKALKEEVASRTGGKLDYLVNNAGRNYTVPAVDVDFDQVKLTYEVNVFGVMRMCQAFSPLLIEAKGTIIQILLESCHTSLARFTTAPRLLCILTATLSGLSWNLLTSRSSLL